MLLLLTAIDRKGQVRTFSTHLPRLETALDVLNELVGNGHYLIWAQLVEGQTWLFLPVEVFDGRPMTPILRRLEEDWQQQLAQPVRVHSVFSQPDNDARLSQLQLTPCHCLIYRSVAQYLLPEKDLITLLQQSRAHNRQGNITGVLLYVQGQFIQVLEGEQAMIDPLFRRIRQDSRHTQVQCVLEQSIEARMFTRWSMGYQTLTSQQLAEVGHLVSPPESGEASAKTRFTECSTGFMRPIGVLLLPT